MLLFNIGLHEVVFIQQLNKIKFGHTRTLSQSLNVTIRLTAYYLIFGFLDTSELSIVITMFFRLFVSLVSLDSCRNFLFSKKGFHWGENFTLFFTMTLRVNQYTKKMVFREKRIKAMTFKSLTIQNWFLQCLRNIARSLDISFLLKAALGAHSQTSSVIFEKKKKRSL